MIDLLYFKYFNAFHNQNTNIVIYVQTGFYHYYFL